MPSSLRNAYLGSSTKNPDIFRQFSKNLFDTDKVKSFPFFVVKMPAADCTWCWPADSLRNNTLVIILNFQANFLFLSARPLFREREPMAFEWKTRICLLEKRRKTSFWWYIDFPNKRQITGWEDLKLTKLNSTRFCFNLPASLFKKRKTEADILLHGLHFTSILFFAHWLWVMVKTC